MMMKKLRRALLVASPLVLMSSAAFAQLEMLNEVCARWPDGTQARPKFSTADNSDPTITRATMGLFPESATVHPYPVPGIDLATRGGALFPPGESFGDNPTNLLPTVYENNRSCMGNEIPNTLASTPERPYNLHLEDPLTTTPTPIDIESPTDGLDQVRRALNAAASKPNGKVSLAVVQRGIDILEGNPIPGKSYSGFPVLHYNGPLKTKAVDPATRTVKVHQIWFDQHIESDTSYIDTTAVEKLPDGSWDNGEWFVEYTVDVLNRGHDDFAPFPMVYDDPAEVGGNFIPNISIDQTFFPMEEGLRYKFTIKQFPARFFNLTYHWGWRIHPPRVQATENLLRGFTVPDANGNPMNVQRNYFEKIVFGDNPRADENAKRAAISMIGDLAPSKRMWSVLQALKDSQRNHQRRVRTTAELATEFEESFFDWTDRNKLPRGVPEDPNADVTLVYLNNTFYGHVKGQVNQAQVHLGKFQQRGDKVRIALKNGDYYPHQYTAVDFGGMRGWENQFHNTIPVGGAGPWFTFGRIHWWPHTIGIPTIVVPAATRPVAVDNVAYGLESYRRTDDGSEMLPRPGKKHFPSNVVGNDLPDALTLPNYDSVGISQHDVEWTFTFDPQRRLRLYQFDAFHHDVAVWSMH